MVIAYDTSQDLETYPERIIMMFKKTLLAAAVLAFGSFAITAQAATTTTGVDMGVQIKIQNACNVSVSSSANNVDFGTVGTLGTKVDATATSVIGVICNDGTTYDVGINAGANASTAGDISTRRMTDGTNFITYQLYQESGHNTAWGNTVSTDTVTGTGDGGGSNGTTATNFTVYGEVPVQTTPAAGTYTDTVQVAVTY